MKLIKKISPIALAVSMAVGGAVVPTIASAEMSANLGIANMYLWRGQNLTPDGPQVSGGIEFSGDTGLYGGLWTSNETGGHETDLYVGFGGEAGDLSYDISYWQYLYPEDTSDATTADLGTGEVSTISTPVDLGDNTVSDIVLGLGYAGVGLTFYVASETQGGPDATYITLDYGMGDYSFLFGTWDVDAPDSEYSHIQVSYAVNDNLSLTVSKASDDGAGVEEDPLFVVSYSIPLDMK